VGRSGDRCHANECGGFSHSSTFPAPDPMTPVRHSNRRREIVARGSDAAGSNAVDLTKHREVGQLLVQREYQLLGVVEAGRPRGKTRPHYHPFTFPTSHSALAPQTHNRPNRGPRLFGDERLQSRAYALHFKPKGIK
jgi:hypothetical protein